MKILLPNTKEGDVISIEINSNLKEGSKNGKIWI